MGILNRDNHPAFPEFWKGKLSALNPERPSEGLVVKISDFNTLAERASLQRDINPLVDHLIGALADAYGEIALLRGTNTHGVPSQIIKGLSDAAFRSEGTIEHPSIPYTLVPEAKPHLQIAPTSSELPSQTEPELPTFQMGA